MKIAVSIAEDETLSPLFDVAKRVWLGEVAGAGRTLELPASDVESKIRLLAAEKVELLLCGAISRCQEAYARSYGIEVEPFLCGPMKEILADLELYNAIKTERRMPGCPGRVGLAGRCGERAGRCAGGRRRGA
jgi:hypothetical protein